MKSLKKIASFYRSIYTQRGNPIICQTVQEAVLPVKSYDMIYVHSVAATPLLLLTGKIFPFPFLSPKHDLLFTF